MVLALAVAVPVPLDAHLTLAPLFRDHAVLQRHRPVTVWGSGPPHAGVTVRFAGQEHRTAVDVSGNWRVQLAPLEADAVGRELVATAGRSRVVAHDVVVGEVWLCAGQSNMNRTVAAAPEMAEVASAEAQPLIRHFRVPPGFAASPRELTGGRWFRAAPDTVGGFSAVGYAFAHEVVTVTGVPLGIIQAAAGGTPIAAWAHPDSSGGAHSTILDAWQQAQREREDALGQYESALSAWRIAEAAARAQGPPALRAFRTQHPRPPRPPAPAPEAHQPAGAFNAMIHSLRSTALGGILWYQGEADVHQPDNYRAAFSRLIQDWRRWFGHDELPFYWVQLPSFAGKHPRGRRWAQVREAQAQALSLPATGMAVTIDVGDPAAIHPPNKREVGRRLALLALRRVYGHDVVDTGPRVAEVARLPGELRVSFSSTGGRVVLRGEGTEALELAGKDRDFVPALGRMEAGMLVVSSPRVPQPVAVRYAWFNAPAAILFDESGLPAAPFRSDDWN